RVHRAQPARRPRLLRGQSAPARLNAPRRHDIAMAAVLSAAHADAAALPSEASAGRKLWRRLCRRRGAMVGLVVVVLFVAAALAAFLGPNLTNAMIAIGVSATPIFVRLTRGQVIHVKVEDYIEAARALGNPPLRIAWRHVLPNILAPVLVQATLAIAAAVI